MTSEQRFFGPVLSLVDHKAVFAGDDEARRMDLARHELVAVREAWQTMASHRVLIETIFDFMRPDTQPRSLRLPMRRLLQGFHDDADLNLGRPSSPTTEQYETLGLYFSHEGYKHFALRTCRRIFCGQPLRSLSSSPWSCTTLHI